MITTKVNCPRCNRVIGRRGLKRHLRWHNIPSPRLEDAIRLYFDEEKTLREVCKELKTTSHWMRRNFSECGKSLRTFSEVIHLSYKHGRKPATPWGEKAPNWKGGRCIQDGGYVKIHIPNPIPKHKGWHPFIFISEHRYVWENAHQQKLPKGWVIHHLNGIKTDNRLENLAAMQRGAHTDLAIPYRHRIKELEERIRILEGDK